MNFLSLIPLFSTLIDRIFPDKEKADEAKILMQKEINAAAAAQAESEAKIIESKSKVIVSEASSLSYAARNWRPHLMYSIMLIVVYEWIMSPLLRAFGLDVQVVPVPPEMWTLLTVGVGGYIGKDMADNYTKAKFNDQKFYAELRKRLFTQGMTQEQVDAIEAAKREAQE